MRLNFDIELLTRRERDRRRYDGECVVKTCETTDEKIPRRTRDAFTQTTSVIRYLGSGDNALPAVTLNRSMFETALRELLVEGEGARVEVYLSLIHI